MSVKEVILKQKALHKVKKYEFVPPEGGWGYVITLSVAVAFIVTVVPLCSFGLVYGKFLASIGDETSGTTLVNGVFNTVLSFTGLGANHMLQKYSYRKVGIIGTCIYFIGNFAAIFVQNLPQLVFSFGVLQGIGFGLIMPASFTAFNLYFDKRKNLMMSICQAIMVAVTIGWPAMTKLFVENFGFRGTVAMYAALSLHALAAMSTLQPVERHMVKKEIKDIELQKVKNLQNKLKESHESIGKKIEGEPLLEEKLKLKMKCLQDNNENVHMKPRLSIVSIGSMALSINNIHSIGKHEEQEKLSIWQNISNTLDLNLFKDPVYINVSFGLSFSITSDLAFLSILPLFLTELGYDTADTTTILTIFFISDLVCRILLSIVNAIWILRNRYLFLGGSLLSALFRIGFILNSSFTWIASMAAALGFLRCLIQTPLPLVIAEEYPERFTSAFSLYMVVCGIVSLVFGFLLGIVKQLTASNIMVLHLLTAAYLLCGIPWSIELMGKKLRRP